MKSFTVLTAIAILTIAIVVPGPARGMQATGSGPAPSNKNSMAKSATTPPSPQQIADAKSKGMVWVNLNTHVYHKDGDSYGTTKRGKFMTEDEATKAGYRAAKEPSAKKPAAAKQTTSH